jgi:HPt (histidine-containing phosphotransfer) domain-containing protein
MKKANLEPLKEQCGSDTAFFNEMLEIFIRSANEGITSMEKAAHELDREMLEHLAHKMVAPFRHLEVETMVTRLKMLEENASNAAFDREKFVSLIHELKSESEDLVIEIRKEYL